MHTGSQICNFGLDSNLMLELIDLLYHYPFVFITLLLLCPQNTFSLPILDRDTSTLVYLTSRVISVAGKRLTCEPRASLHITSSEFLLGSDTHVQHLLFTWSD